MKCAECVFVDIQLLDDDGVTYACHRYPPQLVAGAVYEALTVSQVWPQMAAADWCGEFRSQEVGR